MNEQDKAIELLTEIRDLLALREQQYKDHLAAVQQTYAEQVAQARKTAIDYRIMLFFVVSCSVALALWMTGAYK